jgi:hypothetical protein
MHIGSCYDGEKAGLEMQMHKTSEKNRPKTQKTGLLTCFLPKRFYFFAIILYYGWKLLQNFGFGAATPDLREKAGLRPLFPFPTQNAGSQGITGCELLRGVA